MEAALRMPVLAALGRLRIDPAVAEKVLRAALEVCAALYQCPHVSSCALILRNNILHLI